MNFIPDFVGPVNVNPPIIHRRFNDVNRLFITEQPHIIEDITRIHNHHVLRHTCCVRPMCCEFNTCSVENCCNVPGIVGPFAGPQMNMGMNQGCGGPGCQTGGVGFGPGVGPRPR